MACTASKARGFRETATWANAVPTARKGQQAAAALVPCGGPGSCTSVKEKNLGTQLMVQIWTWKKFRAEAEPFSLPTDPQEHVSIQRRITPKKLNAERIGVQLPR